MAPGGLRLAPLARLEAALVARLPPELQRRMASRIRPSPTRDGAWFLVILVGVLMAAVNTGNNLLYLALSSLLGVLVSSNVLAEWNLRGVRVRRVLPLEAFAGRPAVGAFVVENRRRLGGAAALVVEEVAGTAEGWRPVAVEVPWVPAGGEVEVPCRWTLPHRGLCRLEAVRLRSSFPFGLMARERILPLTGELLVYPEPAPGPMARAGASAGHAREDRRRSGPDGDFRGLRGYVPGDPLRDVHWITTARTGRPMVIERHGAFAERVIVEVPEVRGRAWEDALDRASGQIVRHFRWGHAVGLRMEGRTLPPGSGPHWRRRLLELLALAPDRGEGP